MDAVSESVISSEAEVIVSPAAAAEPLIDRASASPTTLSSVVDSVKVPDAEDPPAAMTTSKSSSPCGIE